MNPAEDNLRLNCSFLNRARFYCQKKKLQKCQKLTNSAHLRQGAISCSKWAWPIFCSLTRRREKTLGMDCMIKLVIYTALTPTFTQSCTTHNL